VASTTEVEDKIAVEIGVVDVGVELAVTELELEDTVPSYITPH